MTTSISPVQECWCRLRAVNLLSAEAFVTVVNLGSLQKAADRLGVSSATISRRLTELESELGVRLVERTTRSLRVTDLGRAFHAQCERGLDALADARDLVASKEARVAGTVRISAPPILGPLLLSAIAQVRRAHPEVHVILVETERRLEPRRDDVKPGLSTNDYATLAHAVRSGMGIGELPAILFEQRASLVRVLPKWTLGEITLNLLFASDRLLSRAVRAVIDAIMATVPDQARK